MRTRIHNPARYFIVSEIPGQPNSWRIEEGFLKSRKAAELRLPAYLNGKCSLHPANFHLRPTYPHRRRYAIRTLSEVKLRMGVRWKTYCSQFREAYLSSRD